jgi:hypothetical protein
VFAPGDGLDPYRRLVDAATSWLADHGALLLQLDRRIVIARRADLPALRAALSPGTDDMIRGVVERFAALRNVSR